VAERSRATGSHDRKNQTITTIAGTGFGGVAGFGNGRRDQPAFEPAKGLFVPKGQFAVIADTGTIAVAG